MKHLYFSFCLLLSALSASASATIQKLIEVNAEWKNHPAFLSAISIDKTPATETAWIQLHLTLVEQHIRGSIATSGLTKQQQQRKHAALDELRLYIAKAEFPINEQYNYRTPIFIDAYNNFCAVGYLLKQTGQEVLARKISKEDNLVYVRKIKSDVLMAWASEYGFSVDELAWIQPSYLSQPSTTLTMIGGGVDDEVRTLYVDSAKDLLYLAGRFKLNGDNSMGLSFSGFDLLRNEWKIPSNIVLGAVNKIINYRDTLFFGGKFESYRKYVEPSFYNVAFLVNDTLYGSIDTLFGTVNDLIEYDGKLYAAGNFTSRRAKNVAQWNGEYWDSIPGSSIVGTINAMTVFENKLIMAGEFDVANDSSIKNVIAYSDSGFTSVGGAFPYRVNDIEVGNNYLVAATDGFINGDTSGIWLLHGGAWSLIFKASWVDERYAHQTTFNMLKRKSDSELFVSGKFDITSKLYVNGASTGRDIGTDFMTLTPYPDTFATAISAQGRAHLDDVIYDIAYYKGRMILGGAFTRCRYEFSFYTTLNGLAYLDNFAVGIDEANELAIGLYPNPASASITITLPAADNSATASIYNVQGQWVQSHTLTSASNTLQMGDIPAGMYVVQVISGNGTGQKRLVKY